MKLIRQIILLSVVLPAVGCGTEYHANQMINVDTGRGKFDLAVLRSPDELVAAGKITSYQPATIGEQTLQLWLITASPAGDDGAEALGTILLIHDIGRSKASMLSLGGKLAALGYDVVLPDLRAHGESTGEAFTYGANEKHDLKIIMDALLLQGSIGDKIVAFGTGVGGSVAIEYAAIDPNCVGVVAFQPYADIAGKLHTQGTFRFLSNEDLAETIRLGSQQAKFDPQEASAVDSAAALDCPLLLLRRRMDFGYPAAQADAIYQAAAGPKDIFDIPFGDDWAFRMSKPTYLAGALHNFSAGGLVTGYYRAAKFGEPFNPEAIAEADAQAADQDIDAVEADHQVDGQADDGDVDAAGEAEIQAVEAELAPLPSDDEPAGQADLDRPAEEVGQPISKHLDMRIAIEDLPVVGDPEALPAEADPETQLDVDSQADAEEAQADPAAEADAQVASDATDHAEAEAADPDDGEVESADADDAEAEVEQPQTFPRVIRRQRPE